MTSKELCEAVRILCEGSGHQFIFLTEDRTEWSFSNEEDSLLSRTGKFIQDNVNLNNEDSNNA